MPLPSPPRRPASRKRTLRARISSRWPIGARTAAHAGEPAVSFWLASIIVFLGGVYVLVHAWLVLPWLWPAGLGLRLVGESVYAGVAGDAPLLIARPPNLAGPSAPADVAAVVPGGPAAGGGAEGRSRVTAPRSSGARGPATSSTRSSSCQPSA